MCRRTDHAGAATSERRDRLDGEIVETENKTAPEGAVGPDCSGGVHPHATPDGVGARARSATRTAVLIDGFNLYHGMRERYSRRYLWLDVCRLAARMRPQDHIVDVTYYTSLVENDPTGRFRQEVYLNALRTHNGPGLDVVLGRFQSKVRRCRACGASWRTHEEKETDVNIAVGLVTTAARTDVDLIVLVTADSDLCPAIRSVRSLYPGVGMIVAFPPRRTSFEIRTLVPGSFIVGADKLRRSLLPDIVVGGSGHVYRRPAEWR